MLIWWEQDFDGWSNVDEIRTGLHLADLRQPPDPSSTRTRQALAARATAACLDSAAARGIGPGPFHSRRVASYARAEMATYSFLSTWCVAAPARRVWDVLAAPEEYPEWWKGVRKASVIEPGEDGGKGVGTLYRLRWRSKLPYTLEFDLRSTRIEEPQLIEAQASGELAGVGVWRLFESPLGTVALYNWDVSTTRAWMNRLSLIGRPVFAWNHDYVMRQGAEGLADKLGVELITHN